MANRDHTCTRDERRLLDSLIEAEIIELDSVTRGHVQINVSFAHGPTNAFPTGHSLSRTLYAVRGNND